MARNLFFIQPCSTCGRRLRVRVVDLGEQLVCQHCGADFVGEDPESLRFDRTHLAADDPVARWIGIADEILIDESIA